MANVDSLSERIAGVSFQRRRNVETERKFNDKARKIEAYREALNTQIIERKKREEAEKEEQNALAELNISEYAEMLRHSKEACLLHSRQVKEKREMEMSITNYRHQYQQPGSRQEYDLDNPDPCGKSGPGEALMMLPGLLGEDRDIKGRRQRQKEQLRDWLVQQKSERAAERQQRKLAEQSYDESRVEIEKEALQLQRIDMERREAAAIATKEYNLIKAEEKRQQRQLEGADDDEPTLGMVGVPGLCPSSDRRAPPQSLQKILQFQKHQIEEKKRIELEKKQEEEHYDRVRVDSAHSALLKEREQARLDKQLRQQVDSINIKLAQTHKQQNLDVE